MKKSVLISLTLIMLLLPYTSTLSTGYQVSQIKENGYTPSLSFNSTLFSTFLGGDGDEFGTGLEIDGEGFVYVVGHTSSADLPMVNAFNDTLQGYEDGFIIKIDPNYTSIVWSTYLGGSDLDGIHDIVIDDENNIYVVGSTLSTDFPTKDAYDSTYNGGTDAFISKFNSSGSLVYSTYIAMSFDEIASAIAIDTRGCMIIALDGINAFEDLYTRIVKLSPMGDLVEFHQIWSGSGYEYIGGLAIDSTDNIYFTGTTASSNFPTINAYDSERSGNEDIFIVKLNSTGHTKFSTYFGGSDDDWSSEICLDEGGSIYITGGTFSTDFPLTIPSGPRLMVDAYMSKFDTNGSVLLYSTTIGGTSQDMGNDLEIDTMGFVYITGGTYSSDFPVINADGEFNRIEDIFVCRINTSANEFPDNFVYSNLYGGFEDESANAIAIDPEGHLVVLGTGYSNDIQLVSPIDDTTEDLEMMLFRIRNDFDSDNDQMPDWWELYYSLDPLSADHEGDPDFDELVNLEEYFHETDPRNNDSDFDQMPDGWEVQWGLNPVFDDADLDPDYDNLTNLEEYYMDLYPYSRDGDDDSMWDYWEVNNSLDPHFDDSDFDYDDDGIINLIEFRWGCDPWNNDTDSDLMIDSWEIWYSLNPRVNDSALDYDEDLLTNLQEYYLGTLPDREDSDRDDMPDGWEYYHGLDPLIDNGEQDADLDGITNYQEYLYNTHPLSNDTDSDAIPDLWEIDSGTDPLVDDALQSYDSDELTNIDEYLNNCDPWNNDTDRDNIDDYTEVYVYGTSPLRTDTDSDLMQDLWEIQNDLNPLVNDADLDADNDGLSNLLEYQIGTDVWSGDSDSDSIGDAWEHLNGFDPLDPTIPLIESVLISMPLIVGFVIAVVSFTVFIRFKFIQMREATIQGDIRKEEDALEYLRRSALSDEADVQDDQDGI
ncbi:MAG: SBBP repeat-containing protein [Candidatus Thorarchaeota archaeon]